MLILEDINYYPNYETASKEYNNYIKQHISNVKRSWKEVLKPFLEVTEDEKLIELLNKTGINKIEEQIFQHDNSKYEDSEYIAYRNNFYPVCPEDHNKENQHLYDLAWLHHQHNNSHHPQYWILYRDENTIEFLDMDFASICEMLCDWHSFSYIKPNSTAYNWYYDNNIPLSHNTKNIVRKIIDIFNVK